MNLLVFPLLLAASSAAMAAVLHYGRVAHAVWAGSGHLRWDMLALAAGALLLQLLAATVARVLGLGWIAIALAVGLGITLDLLPPVSLSARELFESMLD